MINALEDKDFGTKFVFFVEGGNPEKNPRGQIGINQSQPAYKSGIEPGSQWWEAKMMTIAST